MVTLASVAISLTIGLIILAGEGYGQSVDDLIKNYQQEKKTEEEQKIAEEPYRQEMIQKLLNNCPPWNDGNSYAVLNATGSLWFFESEIRDCIDKGLIK